MKKIIKKVKKVLIRENRDIIVAFRILIYTSNNIMLKIKFFRLILLFSLFFKKYILKRKLTIENKKTLSNFKESKISKRPSMSYLIKECIESDIVIINIWDTLINLSIDINYKNNFKNLNNQKILELNKDGEKIYSTLKNNKKQIVFLNDKTFLKKEVINFLEDNNIKASNIIYIKDNNYDKNIKEFLTNNFNDKQKIAYVGSYFKAVSLLENRKFKIYAYENPFFWGKYFRPNYENLPELNVYSNMVNVFLHTSSKPKNKYYEFGYVYGGLISYYIFVEMTKKNESFEIAYLTLKEKIDEEFKEKDSAYINNLFNIIFPQNVNNFLYDKNVNIEYITPEELRRQFYIQYGIIDFCKEFEEKLMYIMDNNSINYKNIKALLTHLTNNKRKRLWGNLW